MSVHYHPGYPAGPMTSPMPSQPWPMSPPPGPYGVVAPPLPAPPSPPPGWPPAPYPGGWPPAPYPPARARRAARTWAIVGTVAAVLVIAGAGVVLTTTGEAHSPSDITTATPPAATTSAASPTATPASIVPVDALPGLLADPAAINAIVGSAAMTPEPEPHPDVMWSGANLDKLECLSVYHPAEKPVYAGSGWIAMQGQVVREPGEASKHSVVQAVISFPSAQAATDFVAQQSGNWGKCNAKSITTTLQDGSHATWLVNAVTKDNSMVQAQLTQEGGNGWACQRALTADNNVVVDVAACGYSPAGQATAVVSTITGHAA